MVYTVVGIESQTLGSWFGLNIFYFITHWKWTEQGKMLLDLEYLTQITWPCLKDEARNIFYFWYWTWQTCCCTLQNPIYRLQIFFLLSVTHKVHKCICPSLASTWLYIMLKNAWKNVAIGTHAQCISTVLYRMFKFPWTSYIYTLTGWEKMDSYRCLAHKSL